MKRLLFMLIIPLVLLSGCYTDSVKHENIAYKTTVIKSGVFTITDYYIVDKQEKFHAVDKLTWDYLGDVPIK